MNNELKRLGKLESAHPGLLLDKLGLHMILTDRNGRLDIREKLPKTKKKQDYPGDRETVFKAVFKNFREIGEIHACFFDELKNTLSELREHAMIITARLKSDLTTGLTAGTAMKTGLTFHYTYGVPIIPGSSVKGACRNAVEESDNKKLIEDIYGTSVEHAKHKTANGLAGGNVIFLDALPVPDKNNHLRMDVMTPHHTNYYEQRKNYKDAPDVENPVPVHFITVPEGTEFMFGFISKSPDLFKGVEKHFEAACFAGFGAKTTSGYGWFQVKECQSETLT